MWIAVIDGATGAEDWRGPLGEFLESNADGIDPFEAADIADTLKAGLSYFIGGGAAADFILQRVG